jgi:chemotaxis signal transduction protein
MTGRILIFEAGGERISLPLEQVAEVQEVTASFPLPLAPPFLGRAISAHGCLIPVVDMGMFLGRESSAPSGRILVMAGDGVSLALQVDRVTDIVQGDAVTGEKPAAGEPFDGVLEFGWGEAPLLSLGQLLRVLERTLAGGGRNECHENPAG